MRSQSMPLLLIFAGIGTLGNVAKRPRRKGGATPSSGAAPSVQRGAGPERGGEGRSA